MLCGAAYDEDEDYYNDDDDEEELEEEEILEKSGARFVRILSDLDDKSLCAIYEVLLFLDEVTVRTPSHQRFNAQTNEIILETIPLQTRELTPTEILYTFQERDIDDREKVYPASDVVKGGLDDLFRKRNIPEIFEQTFGRQVILENLSEGYAGHCESNDCAV